LKKFGEDFPESRRWLLYRGKEPLVIDDVVCLPRLPALLKGISARDFAVSENQPLTPVPRKLQDEQRSF
jgi:hypothetical protein